MDQNIKDFPTDKNGNFINCTVRIYETLKGTRFVWVSGGQEFIDVKPEYLFAGNGNFLPFYNKEKDCFYHEANDVKINKNIFPEN